MELKQEHSLTETMVADMVGLQQSVDELSFLLSAASLSAQYLPYHHLPSRYSLYARIDFPDVELLIFIA